MKPTTSPSELVADRLSQSPLFQDLSIHEVESILPSFREIVYESGEIVCHEHSLGDAFYFILSGKVQVSKNIEGKQIILAYLDAGEGFGEIALLHPEKKRTATITTTKPTTVLELSRDHFEKLRQKHHKFGHSLETLEKQRVSLSEAFFREKKLQSFSRQQKKNDAFPEAGGSIPEIPRFEGDEIPLFELLFKLNEDTGGREQLEHCRETGFLAREMSNILCPYLGDDVMFAAYFHEVGKISLDEELIFKHRTGGQLSADELQKVNDYPNHTVKIIGAIESLENKIDFIHYFLADNYREMPLGAQILRVANDYQEMVHPAYLNLTHEEALDRIKAMSGTTYNPSMVIALEKVLKQIRTRSIKVQLLYLDIIKKALDSKDSYTFRHSRDTTRIALELGKHIGLTRSDLQDLEVAGDLHDIGKIKVPESILNAPRKLEPWEFDIIKKHPVDSAGFVDNIPGFKQISLIIRHHHEKYNGTGYPDGLTGTEAPLLSRILAIADVFSALTTPRVYRRDDQGRKAAFSTEKALEIMQEMESHFDPEIFAIFSGMIRENLVSNQN
ncbi:MAG: HD domain-containing protein [Deltaproteobacteria bacterium]|nr:HD domain-containing protein [Candidatus Anaeroferrophillacea bacterium]